MLHASGPVEPNFIDTCINASCRQSGPSRTGAAKMQGHARALASALLDEGSPTVYAVFQLRSVLSGLESGEAHLDSFTIQAFDGAQTMSSANR